MTHISHRFTFTALKSARLSGEPCMMRNGELVKHQRCINTNYIKNRYLGQVLQRPPFSAQVVHWADYYNMLQFMIVEVRSSEGHNQISKAYQRAIWVGEEANHHMTIEHCHRSLITILEKARNYYYFFCYICYTKMQSSMDLAGVQWNMPVLSYFISVLAKSKSLAWSSAIPTSSFPFFSWSAGLLVGLKHIVSLTTADSFWKSLMFLSCAK